MVRQDPQHAQSSQGLKFVCSVCKKGYKYAASLLKHERSIHKKLKPYTCSVCGKGQTDLRRHMRIHTKEKPYQCLTCGLCFAQACSLKNHALTHQTTKQFQCNHCGLRCTTKQRLRSHLKIHNTEKKFVCTFKDCGKSFTVETYLSRHLRVHTGEKPYSCKDCGRRFSQHCNMRHHAKTQHAQSLPYQCPLCNESFMFPKHRLKHVKTHKGFENAKTFEDVNQLQCRTVIEELHEEPALDDGEDLDFVKSDNLTADQKRMLDTNHNESEVPIENGLNEQYEKVRENFVRANVTEKISEQSICTESTYKTGHTETGSNVSSKGVEGHSISSVVEESEQKNWKDKISSDDMTQEKLNTELTDSVEDLENRDKDIGERSEDTEVIQKSFVAKLDKKCKSKKTKIDKISGKFLQKNDNRPLDAKSYQCSECGKSYTNRMNLSRHRRSHTDRARMFVCDTCGNKFTQQHHLMAHIRSHTGEKPYKCEVCGKSCSQSQDLKKHMRTHSGERPYQCHVCAKTFTQIQSLHLHIKRHSNDMVHPCSLCDEKFRSKRSLSVHLKRSHCKSLKNTYLPLTGKKTEPLEPDANIKSNNPTAILRRNGGSSQIPDDQLTQQMTEIRPKLYELPETCEQNSVPNSLNTRTLSQISAPINAEEPVQPSLTNGLPGSNIITMRQPNTPVYTETQVLQVIPNPGGVGGVGEPRFHLLPVQGFGAVQPKPAS